MQDKGKALILDMGNLAWRAFYATGHLRNENDVATGVLYGLFRDIREFQSVFPGWPIVFAFDGGCEKRRDIFPDYKKHRHENRTLEQIRSAQEIYQQLDNLFSNYLPELGFSNILFQKGYEADDLIAEANSRIHTTVLVSGDQDLYQLLDEWTRIYMPISKRYFTVADFQRKYEDVGTLYWREVKAVAGCKTDGIPGVPGVGEITAVRYFNQTLSQKSNAYRRIFEFIQTSEYERNLRLVEIPFDGKVKVPEIKMDKFDPSKWNSLMEKLGFSSLSSNRGREVLKKGKK